MRKTIQNQTEIHVPEMLISLQTCDKNEAIYTEQDFNKNIVIKERERKRIIELMKAINASEKSIIFCATQAHVELVRELINQDSFNMPTDYCVRVTS